MASEVFLIFTTKLYKSFSAFSLFALFSDEPEVFLPECSQMAILHAADFRRLVNIVKYNFFFMCFTGTSLMLLHLDLTLITNTDCARSYGTVVQDDMICAKRTTTLASACQVGTFLNRGMSNNIRNT